MSELGRLLKKARLERKLSLDDLQESTKIRKRYLEAIEEDDYKVLPGSFYARAFIKSYAEAVGLDPEQVMAMYRNVIPQVKVESNAEPTRTRRRPIKNMDKLSKWASSILMVSFLLLILILIYTWWYQSEPKQDDANEPRVTEQLAPLDEDEPEQPPVVVVPPQTEEPPPVIVETPEVIYVNTDSSTYIYTATHAEQLQIELSFPDGDCWVHIKKDNNNGEDVLTKTFARGATESLTVDSSVWIRFGHPRSAVIEINGIELEEEMLKDRSPWNIQVNLAQDGGVN